MVPTNRFTGYFVILTVGVYLVSVVLISRLSGYYTGYQYGVKQWRLERNEVLSVDELEKICTPKKNIYFLKVHKCGSSTAQRVLLARAYWNHLTIATNKNGWFLGWPSALNVDLAYGPHGIYHVQDTKFNIFAQHSIYNGSSTKILMPTDTVYIGIVRSIPKYYASAFEYFQMERIFGMDMSSFASRLPNVTDLDIQPYQHMFAPRNGILADFGVAPITKDVKKTMADSIHGNATLLDEAVNRIVDEFDFIMIADRMDESLVLLADLLCWPLEDMVVQNYAVFDPTHRSRTKLSGQQLQNVVEWNSGDHLLYETALVLFNERTKRYGRQRLQQDVRRLRRLQSATFDRCQGLADRGPNVSTTADDVSDSEYCEVLTTLTEPQLTYILKRRQWPNERAEFQRHHHLVCDNRPAATKTSSLLEKYCDE